MFQNSYSVGGSERERNENIRKFKWINGLRAGRDRDLLPSEDDGSAFTTEAGPTVQVVHSAFDILSTACD